MAPRLGVLAIVDAGGCVHLRTSDLLALAQLQPGSWQPPAAAGGRDSPPQPLLVRYSWGRPLSVFDTRRCALVETVIRLPEWMTFCCRGIQGHGVPAACTLMLFRLLIDGLTKQSISSHLTLPRLASFLPGQSAYHMTIRLSVGSLLWGCVRAQARAMVFRALGCR